MYLAYVYKLTHKISNEIYFGYRYGNVKLKITPENDLGKKYFTSSGYIDKNNFHEYNHEILFKFESPDEAYDCETKLINENWYNPLLLNRHRQTDNTDRFKITEAGIEKLRKSNSKKHWYNNGIKECHLEICPDGFVPGRLKNPFPRKRPQSGLLKEYVWFNNGKVQTMAKDAPAGFTTGRLPSSIETNKKISDTMKNGAAHSAGKKWYTDGTKSVLARECPLGWISGHSYGSGNSHLNRDYTGTHWYTNGVKSVRARNCPDGFYPGRTI